MRDMANTMIATSQRHRDSTLALSTLSPSTSTSAVRRGAQVLVCNPCDVSVP
jgi:hypothetical protein